MNTKKVFLLLNGAKPNQLPDLSSYKIICATDGAYAYLKEHDITPDFISGDFDSLKTIPKAIEVIHTPDQNYTDFDKVLQVLYDKGFYNIDVYGASGKEQDHFLGNLHTAIQWKSKLKLTFFDNYGHYFLAKSKCVIPTSMGCTVSLVPFPMAEGIVTKGLEYPLLHEDLLFGTRIGTRNKAIKDTIEITHTKGDLFIFINN